MYVAIPHIVYSITVDCLVSSVSHAVAIGAFPENFTEKPEKDAVNIDIRFSLRPYWINPFEGLRHGFAFEALGVLPQSSMVARSGQTTMVWLAKLA